MNIYEKIQAISEEAERIPKNGHNKHSNYDYIRAVDVVGYIKKLMMEHKVHMHIEALECERLPKSEISKNFHTQLKSKAVFVNLEDIKDTLEIPFYGVGADTLDKDLYKAETGGLKYLYTKTFKLITDDFIDPEDDSKTNKTASKKTVKVKTKNPVDDLKKSLFGGMKELKYNDAEAKNFYDFHMTGKLPDEITLLDFIDNLPAYSAEFKESKL